MTEQQQLVISYKTVGETFIIERRIANDGQDQAIEPEANPLYQRWLEDGKRLQAAKTWINFALAEWLEQGFRAFGEAAAQGIDLSIWGSESKLNKVLWVNRAVPVENRILDGSLTWSHFHAVAAIKDKAIQRTWLQKAIDENLSANELGRQVKAANRVALGLPAEPPDYTKLDWVEAVEAEANGHHANGNQANGFGDLHPIITTGHGFVDALPAITTGIMDQVAEECPEEWEYGDLPGQAEFATAVTEAEPDEDDPEGYLQISCPHCSDPILIPKRMIRDALQAS